MLAICGIAGLVQAVPNAQQSVLCVLAASMATVDRMKESRFSRQGSSRRPACGLNRIPDGRRLSPHEVGQVAINDLARKKALPVWRLEHQYPVISQRRPHEGEQAHHLVFGEVLDEVQRDDEPTALDRRQYLECIRYASVDTVALRDVNLLLGDVYPFHVGESFALQVGEKVSRAAPELQDGSGTVNRAQDFAVVRLGVSEIRPQRTAGVLTLELPVPLVQSAAEVTHLQPLGDTTNQI
jgi:hypothetical protein